MIIVPDSVADHIKNDYVCAACWGVLYTILVKEGGQQVLCVDCGEEVPGLVSNHTVLIRIDESRQQFYMARDALKDAVPWIWPQDKRPSPDQILKALGY